MKLVICEIDAQLTRLNENKKKMEALLGDKIKFLQYQDKWAQSFGMQCPECDTSQVVFNLVELNKDYIAVKFECKKCSSSWIGSYTPNELVSITIYPDETAK